jgi:hypothetical protein
MTRAIERKAPKIECSICGLKFKGYSPLDMLMHLITVHPIELAQSEPVQRIMNQVYEAAFKIGKDLAGRQ